MYIYTVYSIYVYSICVGMSIPPLSLHPPPPLTHVVTGVPITGLPTLPTVYFSLQFPPSAFNLAFLI